MGSSGWFGMDFKTEIVVECYRQMLTVRSAQTSPDSQSEFVAVVSLGKTYIFLLRLHGAEETSQKKLKKLAIGAPSLMAILYWYNSVPGQSLVPAPSGVISGVIFGLTQAPGPQSIKECLDLQNYQSLAMFGSVNTNHYGCIY